MTPQLLVEQSTEALRAFRAEELEALAAMAEQMCERSLAAESVPGYERFAVLIRTTERNLQWMERLHEQAVLHRDEGMNNEWER